MEKLLKISSHKYKKIYKKSIRKEFKRNLISYKNRTKQFLINENFDLIKPLIFIINIALLFINILLLFIPLKNNKYSSPQNYSKIPINLILIYLEDHINIYQIIY